MNGMRETRRVLDESRRVLIASHVPPDGDGLGTGLALVRVLRSLGGEAVFASGGPVQANLAFLPEPGEMDESPAGPEGPFDTAIALDSGSFARLGDLGERCRACDVFLNIDHHATGFPAHTGRAVIGRPERESQPVRIHRQVVLYRQE